MLDLSKKCTVTPAKSKTCSTNHALAVLKVCPCTTIDIYRRLTNGRKRKTTKAVAFAEIANRLGCLLEPTEHSKAKKH